MPTIDGVHRDSDWVCRSSESETSGQNRARDGESELKKQGFTSSNSIEEIVLEGGTADKTILDSEQHASEMEDPGSQVGMRMVGTIFRQPHMIDLEFNHHDQGVARLNNGSFGCCPASVLADQVTVRQHWLEHQDKFFYLELDAALLAARLRVAALIQAPDVEEVVLIDNVTTAAAMVAEDVAWSVMEGKSQKGDAILLLNFAYGAVRVCFEAHAVSSGLQVVYAQVPFPVNSPLEVVAKLKETLEGFRHQNPSKTIRLAVLDHILSMPTLVLPIKEMVAICREYGVEHILVDGAHAIGSVEINVHEIDADFYTSNLHKWMFTPSTVAFLHCKRQHLSRLHHPIISTMYGKGLAAECGWAGTRDYTAQLVIPSAVNFIDNVVGGVKNLMDHNHHLVVAMGEMLADAWGTSLGGPPAMFASMTMVGLPPVLNILSEDEAFDLRTRFRNEFLIEVPVFYLPPTQTNQAESESQEQTVSRLNQKKVTAYVRVSHQIYNKLEDYHRLRDAVNFLLEQSEENLNSSLISS